MTSQLGKKLKEYSFAYALLLPALLILTVIILIPLVEAVGYSFTSTSLISYHRRPFVGLDNYRRLIGDSVYWTVFRNTIFIVFTSVAVSLVIGVLLALVLNVSTRTHFLRGLIIIPWLIPGVVVGIIWNWMLATEAGIMNYMLRSFGLLERNFPFLAHQEVSRWVVVIVFVWSSVPYIVVTALAALQAVPQDLEEAAIIDGATYRQRFFFVVLPIIIPVISIAVVLRVIYTMQDFAIIYSLTQGGPGYATETFVISVYKTAFSRAQIGMACAIGVTWLVFLLVFVVAYFRLLEMTERRMYN